MQVAAESAHSIQAMPAFNYINCLPGHLVSIEVNDGVLDLDLRNCRVSRCHGAGLGKIGFVRAGRGQSAQAVMNTESSGHEWCERGVRKSESVNHAKLHSHQLTIETESV